MRTGAQSETDGRVRFDQIIPNRILRWMLYAAAWTIIGLVNFGSALLGMRRLSPDFPAWPPLTWELSSAYVIGLGLVPLLVWVTHRLEFRRGTWLGSLIAHFLLTVPFSLLHVAGMVTIRKAVYWLHGLSYNFGNGNLLRELLFEYYNDIQTYWIIVLVTLGFEYYNRYRERGQRLAEAQLQNLRDQLNPHFLFNTLNSISSLVRFDPDKAREVIFKLATILRRLLNSSEAFAPLREEFEFIDNYLDIEIVRFGRDKLRVVKELDPASLDVVVPSMLLQPLVENSIKHGLASKVEGGSIFLRSRMTDSKLVIEVEDDGVGMAAAQLLDRGRWHGMGIGMANISERLQVLYGDAAHMTIDSHEGKGTLIRIRLPLLQEASAIPVGFYEERSRTRL